MQITTNNVPRDLMDASELSATEREQFDYLNWPAIDEGTDSATFFRYKGYLYNLSDFMRLESTPGWDGGHGDSAFSGILVRLVENGERVIVGWYTS